MTKKDFILIAEYINKQGPMSHKNVIQALCLAFKKLNPRFDRTKFLNACAFTEQDIRFMGLSD